MAILDAARREGLARDLERDEASHQIELANIAGNHGFEESLRPQREIKDRINSFVRNGLILTASTARAQQLGIDNAQASAGSRTGSG